MTASGTYTVELDPTTFPPGTVLSADPDGVVDLKFVVTIGPGENVRSAVFGLSIPVLPKTGSSPLNILRLAFALLALGLVLTTGRRRRARPQSSSTQA